MKPLTKKILMACAVLSAIVFACDIKKEKVSALIPSTSSNSSAGKGTVVAPIPARPIRPEDRAWRLCWRKLPGPQGIDISKTEGCDKARVVRIGASFFDVEVFYEHQWKRYTALYQWNKAENPQEGIWHQPAPKGGGEWFLEKNGEKFVGWETHRDTTGKIISRKTIWLESM